MEKRESRHKHKARHVMKPKGMGITDKIFIIILAASIIYISYLYFQDDIVQLLKMNPYLWAFIMHIKGEIAERTLLGLFYACFFGSLFFIFLPVEVILLYYISLNFPVPLVIALTMIGFLMGLCLDYLFGFIVGARIIRLFFRERFDRFHDMVSKWGTAIVFFGNAIVFPIQPVSVVIGSAKYPFKKFIIFTLLGMAVKFFALVIAGRSLAEYIYPLI